eukprot:1103911-Prorocentrum_minimum.AAC.1
MCLQRTCSRATPSGPNVSAAAPSDESDPRMSAARKASTVGNARMPSPKPAILGLSRNGGVRRKAASSTWNNE